MDENQNKDIFGGNPPEENNSDEQTISYEYKVDNTHPPEAPVPPPQQGTYSNQTQQPNWINPPQNDQTNWAFSDYGSLGTTPKTPPVMPKLPKAPKPPKQKGNNGLKIFSIIISAMFVVSVSMFAVYAMFDGVKDKDGTQTQQSSDTNSDDRLQLNEPPVINNDDNKTQNGILTTQEVFKKASPSVVGIVTYVKQGGHQVYSQGSGVIITDTGYIVTNAHVVLSEDRNLAISKIEVVLSDGEYYSAELIGTDKKTDIGVLKIDAPNLVPAELGNSDKLEVGEPVIVIGNPDGIQFANSLTQGAVSALNREVETSTTGKPVKYIQTDATINPGNSGGAMVNQYGQIVGIPVAKIVKTGFEGMGFAIPINDAKPIVESILKNGYVAGRPKIGIEYAFVPESFAYLNGIPQGMRIATVDESFDAYTQGVKPGDIITHLDDKTVKNSEELATVIDNKKPGDSLKFTIYRVDEIGKASTLNITITLGEEKPTQ